MTHLARSFPPARSAALAAALLLALAAPPTLAQNASSVYVQDITSPANGGKGAAQHAADRLQQALTDANPCVETSDNQDVAEAVADATDASLQEGADPTARLQQIGQMVGANIVVGIQALPAPGGGTQYSAFAMDAKTGRTLARAMGSEDQVARSLTDQLSGALAQNCRPHWVGSVSFSGVVNDSRTVEDGGPMLTGKRNVRRSKTESLSVQSTMTAQLLPPGAGARDVDKPMARVVHRVTTVSRRESRLGGEQYCRVPGKNPYWEGFSESYSETVTMKGRATGTAPVHVLVFSDGRYMIRVTVPGGETIGTFTMEKTPSGACQSQAQPDKDLQSAPPGTFEPSGFDAEGRTDPKRPDALIGSSTLPGGRGTMTWNLRLVKPRGS